MTTDRRRPELDMLRLVVVLGLVFFHAALVFDANDDFYVKNSETTGVTTVLAAVGVVWAMPLLFTVAGIGAWHSMGKRGPGRFAGERLLRLGVPLVFATLTIVPIPPWLRSGADRGSYRQFLGEFFDVRFAPADFPFVLQGRYFETGHLWFVVLLLAYSLLLAAAARWAPRAAARRLVDRLAGAVRRPGAVLVAALPLALVSAVLGLEEGLAAWSRWAYLLFFLYGFLTASDERFAAAIRRHARLAAVLGPLAFLASVPAFVLADGDPFEGMGGVQIAGRALYGLAGGFCLIAILGLLDRPRTGTPTAHRPAPAQSSRSAAAREGSATAEGVPPPSVQAATAPSAPGVPLRAAQESRAASGPLDGGPGRRRRIYAYLTAAALPYYVLHQPIVVVVAYAVVPWDAPMIVEYAVIVAVSLTLTLAAYDVFVRRTRPTRFLFGMRG